ncbi:MAG: DUF4382 domain-containing protein [Candidatus Hydrogenedentes bacterium]|nr:DUF4382 domain-containing protein [Candidatus Hydrogenedentota bacterium]
MVVKSHRYGFLVLAGLAALVLCLNTGCPRPASGKATLTTLFTADSDSLKNTLIKALMNEKAVVASEDIYSLTVTLTEVALDRVGVAGDDEEETLKEQVVIFQGELELDLLNLTGLSEVLSSTEVPAGTYTKIRLEISNPRLVLNDDPDTEITNVQLTANGHLFIGKTFTLEDGEESLLVLDFGGIHLVRTGNGRYVLTPQLQADLTITSAEAQASGEIADLDLDADTFTLLLTDGSLAVDYSAAVIFLETDTDTPTGTEANLADGLTVEVVGLLQLDGSVVADSVRILPAAP